VNIIILEIICFMMLSVSLLVLYYNKFVLCFSLSIMMYRYYIYISYSLCCMQADDNQDVNSSNVLNGYPGWEKNEKPDTYIIYCTCAVDAYNNIYDTIYRYMFIDNRVSVKYYDGWCNYNICSRERTLTMMTVKNIRWK